MDTAASLQGFSKQQFGFGQLTAGSEHGGQG